MIVNDLVGVFSQEEIELGVIFFVQSFVNWLATKRCTFQGVPIYLLHENCYILNTYIIVITDFTLIQKMKVKTEVTKKEITVEGIYDKEDMNGYVMSLNCLDNNYKLKVLSYNYHA